MPRPAVRCPPSAARRPPSAVRFDPFREIEAAWSRMGSLLGDVIGGEHRPCGAMGSRTAAVDVEETGEGFIVELETPDVRADHGGRAGIGAAAGLTHDRGIPFRAANFLPRDFLSDTRPSRGPHIR